MERAQEIQEAITRRITDYSDPDYPVPDTVLSYEKLATYLAELEERIQGMHVHESDGMVYTSNPPQSKCKLCGKFYR